MTPEIPPKKKPPVNLAQPSAVCNWSGSFFLPVKVRLGAVEGSPSLNDAIPYMVRQMLKITTRPPAAKDPAAPAYSVFLSGPAFTNGPTRRKPWARPTSIPLRSGLTAVRYAGRLERYHAINGLDVTGVSRLPMKGSPLIG